MKKKDTRDMTIADHLKNFDFYKDLPRDLQEPSVSGASGSYLVPLTYYSVYGCCRADGAHVHDANLQIHAVQQDERGSHRCQCAVCN